ncbi:MAG: acyltransferase [Proteobacteria bacterium]|nr:acyltransferase [Pseudomonadota bacterium]
MQTIFKGGELKALCSLVLLVVTTISCFIPILALGLIKLIPNIRIKTICTNLVDKIATLWCAINNAYINHILKIKWDIEGTKNLKAKGWYLVIANHQSWLDIVVAHRVFNRKIPAIKFFIKDQLKWVPLLGFAWWAMGCPYMKRYTKEYLVKNPHKKGKDFESTEKAVNLFKHSPTTIMNFVEGTRYTKAKSKAQGEPYQYLLKPRAGGINFVISAMGKQFTNLLDMSIVYPEKNTNLWDFLCGRIKTIKVHVQELTIPPQFTEPAASQNEELQNEFRHWLNENWLKKDALIEEMLESNYPHNKLQQHSSKHSEPTLEKVQ